jgi:hypothetical protein
MLVSKRRPNLLVIVVCGGNAHGVGQSIFPINRRKFFGFVVIWGWSCKHRCILKWTPHAAIC